MEPEYWWAMAGLACLLVLFTMLGIGSARTKNEDVDEGSES